MAVLSSGQAPRICWAPCIQAAWRRGAHLGFRRMGAKAIAGELGSKPTRSVVERVMLFRMQEEMTEEQETNMLDNLYSLQYFFRGIVAISLGRVAENGEGFTHGVYMRFPSKELLAEYRSHPARLRIDREFITPYSDGYVSVNYDAEVEDDLESVFRRGEAFEYGIEHITLLKADIQNECLLQSFARLFAPSLVQITTGRAFSCSNDKYTHCIAARVSSRSALKTYAAAVSEVIVPLCSQWVSVDYDVEAVGTGTTLNS